jgi:hypothetical protein
VRKRPSSGMTLYEYMDTPETLAPRELIDGVLHAADAPIWELALLNGHGPRESGLGLISNHAYSAPYEDLRLKKP